MRWVLVEHHLVVKREGAHMRSRSHFDRKTGRDSVHEALALTRTFTSATGEDIVVEVSCPLLKNPRRSMAPQNAALPFRKVSSAVPTP